MMPLMANEKFNITYSKGALKTLDDMTKKYGFESREKTLEFALFTIKKLHENGTVSLNK